MVIQIPYVSRACADLDTDHVKKCRIRFEESRTIIEKLLYTLSGGTVIVLITIKAIQKMICLLVKFSKNVVGIAIAVFFIWSMVIGHANAMSSFDEKIVLGVTDTSDPSLSIYKSSNTQHDLFRKSVSVVSAISNGDGFDFLIKGEIEARQDSASGYTVCEHGVDEELNVRVREVWLELQVAEKYETCETKPVVYSYDECTRGVDQCLIDLKKLTRLLRIWKRSFAHLVETNHHHGAVTDKHPPRRPAQGREL